MSIVANFATMSPQLKERLNSYGWAPDRCVPEAQVNEWLKIAVQNYGCRIFPEAVRILRQFGGLALANIKVDPLESSHILADPELWYSLEWRLGKVLFPIAWYEGDSELVLLASDGSIYTDGIGSACYWSESFEQMLEMAWDHPSKSTELLPPFDQRSEDFEEQMMARYEAITGTKSQWRE